MAALNFKLEKLKITAFDDCERKTLSKKPNTIAVSVNPESYSLSKQNRFDDSNAIDSLGQKLRFGAAGSRSLSLQLIFDGGRVWPAAALDAVALNSADSILAAGKTNPSAYNQVQKFLQVAEEVRPDLHEPPYLTLQWGTFSMNCRLTSYDVKYTLFDRSGVALQAEMGVNFTEDVADPTGAKVKNSPDLTHFRVVQLGQTLPQLCQEIYGSTAHYQRVARANGLKHFRTLAPGTELHFPPIDDLPEEEAADEIEEAMNATG
ncbi:MAG: hypothetical protein AAF585_29285 [Verrucomicrobiota bacterium]